MNFGFGSSKPKKVKVAAKPPGAESSKANRLVRVKLSTLLSPPQSSQALLGLVLCIGCALVCLLAPRSVSLLNKKQWLDGATLRLHSAYQLPTHAPTPALFRATPKKGDLQYDLKATLFATSLTGPLDSALNADALKLAQQELAQSSTLAAVSGWIRLLCGANQCPSNCHSAVMAHYTADGVFVETSTYPPSMRAQLDGLLALQACSGGAAAEERVRISVDKWIRSAITKDGGYPPQAGQPASVMGTWRAVYALSLCNLEKTDAIVEQNADTVHWIDLCSSMDGGFHDRPASLIERSVLRAQSPILPSLRALHSLALLGASVPSKGLRFALQLPVGASSPVQLSTIRAILDLVPAPTMAVSHVHWSASLMVVALVALTAAACLWVRTLPDRLPLAASAFILGAGVAVELGLPAIPEALTVFGLGCILLHIVRVIPFNDTGEEMLYVSIGGAALTAGLFLVLGFASPDIYLSPPPYILCSLWFPLSIALCVYVGNMLVSRSVTFYTGGVFAGWLLAIGIIAFLLYRRDMLSSMVSLMYTRGYFGPIICTLPVISLWAALAMTHVALSL